MKHSELVKNLAKPANEIKESLTDLDCGVLHMIMGVSGEVGELLDAIKKSIIYRKPLDVENVIEEMGDIEFYLEGLRQELGIDRELVLAKNIEKLSIRYGKTYSNESAIARADK